MTCDKKLLRINIFFLNVLLNDYKEWYSVTLYLANGKKYTIISPKKPQEFGRNWRTEVFESGTKCLNTRFKFPLLAICGIHREA